MVGCIVYDGVTVVAVNLAIHNDNTIAFFRFQTNDVVIISNVA